MSPHTTRRAGPECASDLVLDQLLVDELDADATAQYRAHFDRCGACAARFEELSADQKTFQAAPPLVAPMRAVKRPSGSARAGRGRRTWLLLPVAAALAAALALFFTTRPRRLEPVAQAELPTASVRSKGSSFDLVAVVERGSHQFRAFSGDAVRPGDKVQLAYSAVTRGALYVIGVDGSAHALQYYPEENSSTFVEPGQEVELPFSLVLDQTRGPERFFAFLCETPQDNLALASAAEAAVASAAGARLSVSGCTVRYLELDKP